ncbi:MAG: hypothetical protein N2V78_08970 [Methanophagales archaeon]|nr:hypothetical protein [Methanophagales archaeon]
MKDWIVSENETVTLGGFWLEGVRVARHEFKNDIVTHPVEPGFEITNFIVNEPLEVRLDVTFFSGRDRFRDRQCKHLIWLRDKKVPVEFFSTVTGYVEHMVIESMEVTTDNASGNTYSASIMLKEIQIAEIKVEVLYRVAEGEDVYANVERDFFYRNGDLETPKRSPVPVDYNAILREWGSLRSSSFWGGEESDFAKEIYLDFEQDPEAPSQRIRTNIWIHGEKVECVCHLRWEPPKVPTAEGRTHLMIEPYNKAGYPEDFAFFSGYVWESLDGNKVAEYTGTDPEGHLAFLILCKNHNFPGVDIRIRGTMCD